MYACSTNKVLDSASIINFVNSANAGLPFARFTNYIVYLVPIVYVSFISGTKLQLGFAPVMIQNDA